MRDVTGKYIWILGASSGIGAALARELALRGAKIAISARREDKLQELLGSLDGTGHIAVTVDVGDPESIVRAQENILDTFLHIDSALFMAAIYSAHDGKKKALSFIHDMVNVNLNGAFNLVDCLVPQYETQGHGQLILCASVAGYRGLPTGQPYCATKAALISLSESLKLDLEDKNIDVKLICPGFVKTPLTDKNDFTMPMIIDSKDAARAIAKGMCSRAFEIHFPKRFTFIMKMIRILPNCLYFMLARKLRPDRG